MGGDLGRGLGAGRGAAGILAWRGAAAALRLEYRPSGCVPPEQAEPCEVSEKRQADAKHKLASEQTLALLQS